MTPAQVRKLLLQKSRPYRGRTGSGLTGWCRAHRLKLPMVSHFLSSRNGPSTGILNALGLEWRIVRKAKRAVSRKRKPRK